MSFLNLARDLYLEIFGKFGKNSEEVINDYRESMEQIYEEEGFAGIDEFEREMRTLNIEEYIDPKFFIGKIVKGRLLPPTRNGFKGYTEGEVFKALDVFRKQYPRTNFIICRCVFKTDL